VKASTFKGIEDLHTENASNGKWFQINDPITNLDEFFVKPPVNLNLLKMRKCIEEKEKER